jgi:hypothetical protein
MTYARRRRLLSTPLPAIGARPPAPRRTLALEAQSLAALEAWRRCQRGRCRPQPIGRMRLFPAGACTAPIGYGTRICCSTSGNALPVEMKPASNRRLSRGRGLLLAATSRAYCRPQRIAGTGFHRGVRGLRPVDCRWREHRDRRPRRFAGRGRTRVTGWPEPGRSCRSPANPGRGLPVDDGTRVGSRPEPVADPIDRRIDAGHAPRLIARGRAGGGSGSPLVAPGAALRHLSRRVALAIVRA